jgi:hypothetical protein
MVSWLWLAVAAAADVQLSWQGRLVGSDGSPLDGTTSLRVDLYPTSSSSTSGWGDTFSVPVDDGFFSVVLGSGAALPDTALTATPEVWVAVTIGTTELTRQKLLSVPRAVVADRLTPGSTLDLSGNTSHFRPPTGTTEQRPSSPAEGSMRYNTTLHRPEFWNGTAWTAFGASASTGVAVFPYSGADQVWPIPSGVTSIEAEIWGAGGSSAWSGYSQGGNGGASGGYTSGTINVAGLTSLRIVVGGGGPGPASTNTRAYGGGGYTSYSSTNHGGNGGGLSGIFSNTVSQGDAILIAGGGGGGGTYVPNGGVGGAGGGSIANAGGGTTRGGGGGGTQVGGGAGGSGGTSAGPYGTAGAALLGGNGSAGGGGGYYGGGGGSAGYGFDSTGGGGGGGSSYYLPSRVTNPVLLTGTNGGTGNTTAPAPGNLDTDYVPGVGEGRAYTSDTAGGNGYIVIRY